MENQNGENQQEGQLPKSKFIPENLDSLFIAEDIYEIDEVKEHYKDIFNQCLGSMACL